jgi:hypothetical protein
MPRNSKIAISWEGHPVAVVRNVEEAVALLDCFLFELEQEHRAQPLNAFACTRMTESGQKSVEG